MRGGGPRGEVCEGGVDEGVMPELGGDDGGEAHFDGEAREGAGAQFAEGFAPVQDGGDVEVAGAFEGFLAEELADVFGFVVGEETVDGGTEDGFFALADVFGEPAFGDEAEEVFVPKAVEFPIGMEAGGEVADGFVEEGVAGFDGGEHGDAVAFGLEEET